MWAHLHLPRLHSTQRLSSFSVSSLPHRNRFYAIYQHLSGHLGEILVEVITFPCPFAFCSVYTHLCSFIYSQTRNKQVPVIHGDITTNLPVEEIPFPPMKHLGSFLQVSFPIDLPMPLNSAEWSCTAGALFTVQCIWVLQCNRIIIKLTMSSCIAGPASGLLFLHVRLLAASIWHQFVNRSYRHSACSDSSHWQQPNVHLAIHFPFWSS